MILFSYLLLLLYVEIQLFTVPVYCSLMGGLCRRVKTQLTLSADNEVPFQPLILLIATVQVGKGHFGCLGTSTFMGDHNITIMNKRSQVPLDKNK